MIDLRSDTVTRPSAAMRAAMMAAEVGDDVWGDDPTVNALQARMAALTGKDAALFFPSATQANLAALMSHCQRGDEVILGNDAHTFRHEAGGLAVLGGILPQPIENAADGTLALDRIAAEIKPDDPHFARTRLLTLENTIGGKILPQEYVTAAAALARKHGLGLHLDGARVFNAAVAQQRTLHELCDPFDTVTICFSKGLGAPIGAVLVGTHDLMGRALRARKILGGAMRQSGLLAAACIYALDNNVDRLAEDHANAAALAAGLKQIPGLGNITCATNMVFADIPAQSCAALQEALAARGIISAVSTRTRFVTHLDVTRADIDTVVAATRAFFSR
ncbi:MAG: low-specificity L-threonine aldolase [Rhodobacteraceae bacterium]|nr:low-specificity L-threonine aldolase [Paracoccaceae bacterium]